MAARSNAVRCWGGNDVFIHACAFAAVGVPASLCPPQPAVTIIATTALNNVRFIIIALSF
jgi:hypothetical protein